MLPTQLTKTESSSYGESEDTYQTPRCVSLTVILQGENPGPGDWHFLVVYNNQVVLEGKWQNGLSLQTEELPLNLKETFFQDIITDKPLIFLLRTMVGKGVKDPDPLLNVDNRAGGNVDLFPLLLGEERIYISVSLIWMTTGINTGCSVIVNAESVGETDISNKIPLMITMISANCLPFTKDGTAYLGAIGLDDVFDPVPIHFGMSQSTRTASKVVWASACNGGLVANTAFSVPHQDMFVPEDVVIQTNTVGCRSTFWNAMKRLLIDPVSFRDRLSSPFLFEIAGVPKVGKTEVRGRYMGFVDAGVLLLPGQFFVTACAKLKFYIEADLPENVEPLLELPPASAKVSARDTDTVMDEFGHTAYVIIRFDLTEPLIPSVKIMSLFEKVGFPPPEGATAPVDELNVDASPEDHLIDVRRIRKEGGALAVHNELSGLACRGSVQMNQSIKRTAANRLLMRVRAMLKQFSPGECPEIEWQDTVTSQHAACRRAVTASFAPQPPPLRPPARSAAARCRIAGDYCIADKHIEMNLKAAPGHPRSLLSKALRCLEARIDSEARSYILKALSVQTRNRFLLWIFGGQEFDKGPEAFDAAAAAFRIAVKGDYSDGTANAIGWAAVHALHHYINNPYIAFTAAKKMRKSYELPNEWKKFLERWVETSGEEEVFWIPASVASHNPILIAAAFFLCLRCYKFSEILLRCVEKGCASRGSRHNLQTKISPDIYYLRAASLLLRRQLDKAMQVTEQGIKRFGPSSIMFQMRTSCLAVIHGWDGECASALKDAERAGSGLCPALLIRAALGGIKTNPKASLQHAARAHKMAPSAQSALAISRIYAMMNEETLAKRWAAVSVKTEPLYADGWAILALLAMYDRDIDKARAMLRTAQQVGIISPDIEEEVKIVMGLIKMNALPDSLVEYLCLCDYC